MTGRQHTYFWWTFLLFAFLIPVSQFLSVRVLVVLLFFSFFVRTRTTVSQFLKYSWDTFLFLAVLLIGLLYTDDLKSGLATIETSFSLLALPLVFFRVDDLDEKKLKEICFSFGAGMLAASLICIVNGVLRYSSGSDTTVFSYYEFTNVLGIQPTYFAYYLTFVLTVGLFFMYYEKTSINTWLGALLILFFFVIFLMTGGRTAYISLLLVFSFFILKFFLEEKTRRKKIVFGIIVAMLVSMFALNTSDRGLTDSDYWERLVLWESALKAAPNLFVGVGTGDYQKVLNDYYVAHGLHAFADAQLNPHNQFILLLFSNGMIGLIAILLMLLRPLYWAYRKEYILGTLCMFAFILYGLTEVFLGRYQGVVFFALVHQLFATYYRDTTPLFSFK